MLRVALFTALVALTVGHATHHATHHATDDHDWSPAVDGPTHSHLSEAVLSQLKHHIQQDFDEQMHTRQSCMATAPLADDTPTVVRVKDVTIAVENGDRNNYHMTVEVLTAGLKQHTELDVEAEIGAIPVFERVRGLTNFRIFPECVAEEMEAEAKAADESEEPSTAAERDEVNREIHEPGIDHIGRDENNDAPTRTTNNDAPGSAATGPAATGPHGLSALGHSLGNVQDPEHIQQKHTVKLHASAQAHAADYTPFTGTKAACLSQFPARDQGSCGSCYSFAATSAFSLKYCLEVYNRGYSYDNTAIPVITVQNMVSCSQGLTGACNGGSGYGAYTFLRDYGSTSVACLPYMEGGGDPTAHFEAAHSAATKCYSTCTDAYRAQFPGKPMMKISGAQGAHPLRFAGEDSIKQALIDHGPLYIAFDVLSTFTRPQDFASTDYVYTAENATGTKRGGHAVVVYGWGTTSKGLKYWKLINSWGSWGMPGTHGEFRIERGRNVARIESMGAWTIDLDQSDVATGPASPFPPAPPYPPPSPPKSPPPPSPPPPPPSPPRDMYSNCRDLVDEYGCHNPRVTLGGGLTIPTACPVSCDVAETVSPPPPSPSPPPVIHSPPPPTSSLRDIQRSSSCNYWKGQGYCENHPWVQRNCRRTCAGIPTDLYGNCGDLVAAYGCNNCCVTLGGGVKIETACPDSCAGHHFLAQKQFDQDVSETALQPTGMTIPDAPSSEDVVGKVVKTKKLPFGKVHAHRHA